MADLTDPQAVETPAPEPGAAAYVADIAARHGVEPSDLGSASAERSTARDEAPAEEPSRPSIHERWRERTATTTDPYGGLRQELAALSQRFEQAITPPPAEEQPPPVERAEEYLRWHVRQAIGADLAELRSAIEEMRGYTRNQAEFAQREHAQRQVVGAFDALEREYEAEVPGHRERFGSYLQARTQEVASDYGVPPQMAQQWVLQEVQGLLQRAPMIGAHPVAFIDREVSRYLEARNIQPASASGEGGAVASSASPSPVSRTVAERARAAGSAAAGSLGALPRAGDPKKITAKAVLRRGQNLSRREFDRLVEERLAEHGGNPHAAMDAVRRELHEAATAAA